MAKKTCILSLGTRKDATTWEKGCKDLGFTVISPIKKPSPSTDELTAFFKEKPHWIYFAGHFGARTLENEKGDVQVTFDSWGVVTKVGNTSTTILKRSAGFQLHKNCEVVVWGGCSVCSGEETVRALRALFGRHLLLGFAGLTGWKVVDAILGGGFMKKNHFFDRVAGKTDKLVAVRNAWMQAARQGWGGGTLENRFRAFDPNGQEWRLRNKKIVRGRKIT